MAKSFSCKTPEAGLEPATRYVEPRREPAQVAACHADAVRTLRLVAPEAGTKTTPPQRRNDVAGSAAARAMVAGAGYLAHQAVAQPARLPGDAQGGAA